MKPMVAAVLGALIGGAVVFLVQGERAGQPLVLTVADVQAAVHAAQVPLQDQLAQVSRDLQVLRATPEPARMEVKPAPPVDLDAVASRIDGVTSRIDTLEEKIDRLIQSTSDRELAARKLTEAAVIALKDAQRIATDQRATEKDRLAALATLRNQKTEDGKSAISHDVILGMLDIAERSESEDSRFDVYRNLHRIDDPAVRDSMLRALARDSSVKVRKKVAEDIDTFSSDPAVESALRTAADSDADAGVRAQALMTLAGSKK